MAAMSTAVWIAAASLPILAFVLIIVVAVRSMRRELGAIRTIGRAAASPIGQVQEGALVKVVGLARPAGEPLVAPLTGRPCVLFEASIQHHVGGHGMDRGGPWETEGQESQSQSFLVEDDDGGRAVVETEGAWVLLQAMDLQQELQKGEPRSDEMRAMRRRHGHEDAEEATLRERYLEGIIGEQQRVAVYGRCAWETDPDPGGGAGYRGAPRRLRISAPPGGQVLITTDPGLF